MKDSKETQIIKHLNKHAYHEGFKTNKHHVFSSSRSFSALVLIKARNYWYWQSQVL